MKNKNDKERVISSGEEIKELTKLVNKSELSKEEIYRIFSYYKKTKNEELFKAIVVANEKLVRYLLAKYWNHPDHEDILQEGRLGLMLAVKKFDPDLGYAFSTIASKYISGYAHRYLDEYNTLHIPTSVIKNFKKLNHFKNENPLASNEEAANALGISAEYLKAINEYPNVMNILSLDVQISAESNGNSSLADFIEAPFTDPSTGIASEQIHNTIIQLVKNATGTEKQWYIIKNILGFDCTAKTCREVAAELGVSYQYVNKTVNNLIKQFKEPYLKKIVRKKLGVPAWIADTDVVNYLLND